jgi:hypothetical protein
MISDITLVRFELILIGHSSFVIFKKSKYQSQRRQRNQSYYFFVFDDSWYPI